MKSTARLSTLLLGGLVSGCVFTKPPPLDLSFPKLNIDARHFESCPPLPLLASGDESDVVANYDKVTRHYSACAKAKDAETEVLRKALGEYGAAVETAVEQLQRFNSEHTTNETPRDSVPTN